MTIAEAKVAMQTKAPCEFYSLGWLSDGWYPVTVVAIDENPDYPRVWLNFDRSGQVEVKGEDVRELLRLKEVKPA